MTKAEPSSLFFTPNGVDFFNAYQDFSRRRRVSVLPSVRHASLFCRNG